MNITQLDIKGKCKKIHLEDYNNYEIATCDYLEHGIFFDIYYSSYKNKEYNKYASKLLGKQVSGNAYLSLKPKEVTYLYRLLSQ